MHNNISFAMIALALGYKVFIDASKENVSRRRSFGRAIGIFIMTVSFVICTAPVLKSLCYSTGSCPMMEKICPTR